MIRVQTLRCPDALLGLAVAFEAVKRERLERIAFKQILLFHIQFKRHGTGRAYTVVQAHILPVDPVLRRAQHFVQNGLRLVSSTEAFLDMKQEAWITAHVHAYNYFGGVTRILTPDNLKTGVIKNTRTETVLNKAYQEMAEHYGTAIIPTRPRTPKDKAFVEDSVGVVSTWILAALRNRQFLSFDELNRAIWENLADFNHKPFQKKDGSRASDFEEEKLFLLPLPPNPFELAEWKTATVQYNYHISVDRMNYSVPYE